MSLNQKFANFSETRINGDISNTDTEITVLSVSNLPILAAEEYFYFTLYSTSAREIVKVTAIDGLVLTVVRAQDGTTAITWPTGTKCAYFVVRKVLEDFLDLLTPEVEEQWVRLAQEDYSGTDENDISISGSIQTTSVSGESVHTGIFYSNDGTKVYLTGEATDAVREFNLSTPYDLSTISAVQYTFSTSSETFNPQSVCFTSDGLTMYVLKESTSTVFQYTLSTAWDLSTASYASKSYTVNTDMGQTARDMSVKPDGTKIYVSGLNGNVYEWNLTAGDISTASYVQSFNPSEVGSASHGFAISSDGTKMLISAPSNASVNEYSLSTPWDLSTASFTTETLTINCAGITYSSDGYRLATCSGGNIYDCSLGSFECFLEEEINYIIEFPYKHNLPDSPVDTTRIRVRRFYAGANDPEVNTQGSDTFDDASTTLTLDTDKETAECYYNALTEEWEVY